MTSGNSVPCERCGGSMELEYQHGHWVSLRCSSCGTAVQGTVSYVEEIPRPEWVRLFAVWTGTRPSSRELGIVRRLFPQYQSTSLQELSRAFSGQPRAELGGAVREHAEDLVVQARAGGLHLEIGQLRDPDGSLSQRAAADGARVADWPGRWDQRYAAHILLEHNRSGLTEVIGVNTPKPVVVVPYDSVWPATFSELCEVYVAALGGVAVSVEHVGSTSVPGLAAKPIVDVDIVVSSTEHVVEAIRRLALLGYRHQGDLGVSEREAFTRDGASDVPRDGRGRVWPDHHLYVCAAGSRELRRHLAFRDYLRSDASAAKAYGALKIELTERFQYDRERYTDAKTAFIERILEATGRQYGAA